MREQLETRLNELRFEIEKGQFRAQQLQSHLTAVHETIVRISGAIMVLEEILSEVAPDALVEQPPRDVIRQSNSFVA